MPPWLPPLLVAPFVGSFLGVLVRRLPADRSVVFGRSECETCRRALALHDLVPLLSYILLRGRCRMCGTEIAIEHLAIEAAAVAVVAVTVTVNEDVSRIWAGCLLGWVLLSLAWIDWRHLRLPDVLTLPLIPLGLAVTLVLMPESVADHAVASIVGYAAFRSIGEIHRRWRGLTGLGEGDAKLLAASGAWVGLSQLADVVLGAALLGLVVFATHAFRTRSFQTQMKIAFGPCLAIATWALWLSS